MGLGKLYGVNQIKGKLEKMKKSIGAELLYDGWIIDHK